MSNFKDQLRKAIDSVCDRLNELSSEEFQSKIDSFLYDEKTDAILYAWDSKNTKLQEQESFNYDTFEFEVSDVHLGITYKAGSIVYPGSQPNRRTKDDHHYRALPYSDDYSYKAAA